MTRLEFNDAGIAQVANKTNQLQTVLDRVLQTGQGKSLEDIKVLLGNEMRATFGTEITDPDLSALSVELTAGHRVQARLTLLGS